MTTDKQIEAMFCIDAMFCAVSDFHRIGRISRNGWSMATTEIEVLGCQRGKRPDGVCRISKSCNSCNAPGRLNA